MSMRTFENPILCGSYPDPSICRVGEDYFLVTSTFTYFPGIPVFHSRDLVHWRQIGHALDRPSQLDLDGLDAGCGIYAPTIRYSNGVFYIITTNMGRGGNFVVTATNPAGPWSEPYWLNDAPGIDPSLFFDDDGKVYYTGNRKPEDGEKYSGHREIWIQEFDIHTMTLKGKKHTLWQGALSGAKWTEAPHLYKINGYYYLLVAEGGTTYHHAVTVARSKNIFGPYEGNPANPILTHRHLGRNYPVANVGHADLVETQNGQWWMVVLASRMYGGYYRNLGRETFLAKVTWEDGWPIVNEGKGRLKMTCQAPDLPQEKHDTPPVRELFDCASLAYHWNFIRTPRERFWSLTERKGYLRLYLRPQSIDKPENPSFIGRRQQHMNFSASTLMEFKPKGENESAGIVVLQNNNFYFSLEYTLENNRKKLRLTECCDGVKTVRRAVEVNSDRLYLRVSANRQSYGFFYATKPDEWIELARDIDGRILGNEKSASVTGAYLGMYASSNGASSINHADFAWFEYSGF